MIDGDRTTNESVMHKHFVNPLAQSLGPREDTKITKIIPPDDKSLQFIVVSMVTTI